MRSFLHLGPWTPSQTSRTCGFHPCAQPETLPQNKVSRGVGVCPTPVCESRAHLGPSPGTAGWGQTCICFSPSCPAGTGLASGHLVPEGTLYPHLWSLRWTTRACKGWMWGSSAPRPNGNGSERWGEASSPAVPSDMWSHPGAQARGEDPEGWTRVAPGRGSGPSGGILVLWSRERHWPWVPFGGLWDSESV